MENVIYDNRHDINSIKKSLVSLEEPPVYTDPSCGISCSPTLIEVGKTTNITIRPSYTKNDGGEIKEVKFYKDNVLQTTQTNLNSYVSNCDNNATYKIEITYADGPIKETNLGNPYPNTSIKAGTISRSTNIVAVGLSYYGIDTNLNSTLKNTKAFTYDGITCTNGRIVYKYPKSLGALTSIKDANNFEYINSYTRSEETINNIVYYVYQLNDPVTLSGFKQIFS